MPADAAARPCCGCVQARRGSGAGARRSSRRVGPFGWNSRPSTSLDHKCGAVGQQESSCLLWVESGHAPNLAWFQFVGHVSVMHGQKKRRKRTIEGALTVDDLNLVWELLSEPQYSNSGDGRIGMRIGVRLRGVVTRELIIQYPYPTDRRGMPKPVPQRPQVSQPMIESSIREALASGWDPQSRGKPFILFADKPH